ncbi:MAG: beta-lactamase family protein [bacterium]|nr:MAG: beta-lactamase family protein [bacterium]
MIKKIKVVCVITLVSLLLLAGKISPAAEKVELQPIVNRQFDPVKEMILKEIEGRTIPSASVAVAENGKITWLESFGWADMEKKIKATPHTPYPIASITKSMTATAVMLLAERGKIDIRQSVEKYVVPLKLTAYEGDSRDVTIKHLLNHTAGLAMHFNYYYEDEEYVPPTVEEAIERYGFMIHPPGDVFQYANLGYALLGYLISKVTGTSYEDFLKTEVFEPLGMKCTWVGSHLDGPSPVTSKYDSDLGNIPHALPYAVAAGAAFSSAYDLVKFGMFHLKDHLDDQQQILSDTTIESMQRARDVTAKYVSEDYYGFGWFFNESEGGYKVCWHEGGMGGARSILKLVPSEDIAVVVLLNGWNDPLPGRIAKAVLAILLPDYLENLEKEKIGQSPPFDPYIATPEFTGTWKGNIKTHEGDVPVYMVFQKDGDIHFLKQLDINRKWVLQQQGLFDRLLNNTGIRDDRIYGWVYAHIPTADAQRIPHVMVVDVVRHGRKLNGSVSAVSAHERMYFGLSYYISLEKIN